MRFTGIAILALSFLLLMLTIFAPSVETSEARLTVDRFKTKKRLYMPTNVFQKLGSRLIKHSVSLQWCLIGFCAGYACFMIPGVAVAMAIISWGTHKKYLQLRIKLRRLQIQRELPQFFGIMQGWSEVNNNLSYCIEKAVDASLSNTLIQPYKQLLRESKAGMPMETALENLSSKMETDTQKHFVFCLIETNKRQGKLSELFKGFELESSQVWMEIQKTSLLQMQYTVLIYALFLFALLVLYFLLKFNHSLSYFYLQTYLGKQVLSSMSILSAMAYVREVFTERIKR